jgi:hypothetical protein
VVWLLGTRAGWFTLRVPESGAGTVRAKATEAEVPG